MTKQELRESSIARRASIEPADRALWDQLIFERAHKHRAFQIASRVHVYRSTSEEVLSMPFIEYALGIGKEVYVPITPETGQDLQHCRVTWGTQWTPGRFGILEPVPESDQDLVLAEHFDQSSAVIVPLVAFDKACHRLGYGKGYYDHFLARTQATAIGIAYQCQLMSEVSSEPHDVALAAIATQECWYRP
ncbi:MAG: 5-formyltetrahydrofolate cyclo-ligase [Candidatus Kapabacteria bacterium]|nr:5-formyltetrahydrofolate cyclo-ligase [Candidatus Kapabacteria bacterium]